jgi:hypothetical protein
MPLETWAKPMAEIIHHIDSTVDLTAMGFDGGEMVQKYIAAKLETEFEERGYNVYARDGVDDGVSESKVLVVESLDRGEVGVMIFINCAETDFHPTLAKLSWFDDNYL